ncbi:hypothetical protein LguiA_021778 [Lonicera macranthoides]
MQAMKTIARVRYPRGSAAQDIAPRIVYGTAAKIQSKNTANDFNLFEFLGVSYHEDFVTALAVQSSLSSSSNAGLKNNVGLIVSVTMVVQVAVLVVAALLFWVHKHLFNGINTSAGSNPGHPIPLTTVLEATNNYYESLVVRAGGFGYVYAGTLTDGTITIVKRANPRSRQGLAEFQNEIKMLSHPATSIGFHVMKMMR